MYIFVLMFITTIRPLDAPAFFRWLECRTLPFNLFTEVDCSSSMLNGCQLSSVNFPLESCPLPLVGIELTLFGYVIGSNQRLYSLCHVYLRTSVYEFQDIIKPMSSATIFTRAHIAILLLSLHVFTRAHIATFLLLLLFSGTPYY